MTMMMATRRILSKDKVGSFRRQTFQIWNIKCNIDSYSKGRCSSSLSSLSSLHNIHHYHHQQRYPIVDSRCMDSRNSLLSHDDNHRSHQRLLTTTTTFTSTTTMTTKNNKKKNFNVAIVGAGPSGFYVAKYLISNIRKQFEQQQQQQPLEQKEHSSPSSSYNYYYQNNSKLNIDIIERQPMPYGLVRNGVAPDHPEVKNVEDEFRAMLESSNLEASNDNDNNKNNVNDNNNDDDSKDNKDMKFKYSLEYRGNVTVGSINDSIGSNSNDNNNNNQNIVSLTELRSLYDAVVLAYGTCDADRTLPIPTSSTTIDNNNNNNPSQLPKKLQGVISAREFVGWYNSHPDFGYVGPIVNKVLPPPPSPSSSKKSGKNREGGKVVVIGNGNVALDCARILAKGGSALLDTDLAHRAYDVFVGASSSDNGGGSSVNRIRDVTVVGRRGHVQAAFTIKVFSFLFLFLLLLF